MDSTPENVRYWGKADIPRTVQLPQLAPAFHEKVRCELVWVTRSEMAEIREESRLLAVEAVIGEPVSVGISPVERENTGNFRRSSLKNAIGLSFRTRKSEGYGQIPCASEQGIFRS